MAETLKGEDPTRHDEGTMPSDEDIEQAREETEALAGGSGIGSSAAAALGSAMLGLDQAIRREPPAQIVAVEHQPERGISGDDGEIVIEIPDVGPARARPASERDRS